MGRPKKAKEIEPLPAMRPAITPEARENQLIFLATEQAEKQLREGTASSQVLCHFLKLGTEKYRLEREKLKAENELMIAKKMHLESAQRTEELFNEAIKAFSKYRGHSSESDEYTEDILGDDSFTDV